MNGTQDYANSSMQQCVHVLNYGKHLMSFLVCLGTMLLSETLFIVRQEADLPIPYRCCAICELDLDRKNDDVGTLKLIFARVNTSTTPKWYFGSVFTREDNS